MASFPRRLVQQAVLPQALVTSRRTFLKQISLAGAAAMASSLLPRPAFAAEAFPVVETTCGKLRGMDTAGIKTFRGIRYGASTAGPNRFMPPVKPDKWTGVLDAFAYGPASPQMPGNPADPYTQAVNWDAHVKSGMSEDCLVLNVWTPGLNDNGRRPVLFYIHGGGFANGSGGFTFDGDPLARLANAVVITVNHRLGVLGYLDLGAATGASKFAHASSAGMLDLVAALEWVRDNIASFGGDPGNITIAGQSGGGAKVSTLMAMPAAKGLFHKAIVQSGSTITLGPRDRSTQAATQLLAELSISKDNPEALQQLPWSAVLQAQANRGFAPVVDGTNIPRHPFDPDAPPHSAAIPMIVGYTREDASTRNLTAPEMNDGALQSWARQTYSARADEILSAYKKAYPDATPFQLQARIRTDASTRHRAITMAERKAAQKSASVFLYELAWASPAFEGRFGAAHGVDLGLIMANPRDAMAANTPEGRKMADMVGSAVAAFMKTGNPACDKVPPWRPYDSESRATMILDLPARLENDPTKELRLLWRSS